MSTRTQLKKLDVLNSMIKQCWVYKKTPKESMFSFSTGDGVCFGFLQGADLPLLLALQVHEKLAQYNKGKIPSEMINVRIGLHSGNCFTFTDIQGKKNVWGPGIIMARRVMDLGDDDHILLSPRLAEDLRELSDKYRSIIKPVHDYTVKHNTTMLIYSAHGKAFGNPVPPKKSEYQKSKIKEETIKLQNTALYPLLKVSLRIRDPKTMLVHHKRTYEITNKSAKPIKYVLHAIGTDVEKPTINDLNLKCYDNLGKEMKISSINLDGPYSKEFSTVFENPILKGEKGRSYTLEYDIEEPERFFENSFLVDCKKFILSFTFPQNYSIKRPVLYEVNLETEDKTKSDAKPVLEKHDKHITASWEKEDVVKGQTFRIEW